MGIQISPMTSTDLNGIVQGVINATANNNNITVGGRGSIKDPALFGRSFDHMSYDYQYEDEFVRTAKIQFPISIPNPFLCGVNCETFGTIFNGFGIEGNKVAKALMRGDIVCNQDGQLINSDDIYGVAKRGEYLIGGDAVLKYLSCLDIEQNIKDEVYEQFVYPCLSRADRKDWKDYHKMVGSIERTDEDFDVTEPTNWLFDEFFYVKEDRKELDKYDEEFQAEVGKYAREHVRNILYKRNSRLTYLLALERNYNTISNLVMSEYMILPEGQRMSIDNRVDPITKLYNDLEKTNLELQEALINNAMFSNIISKYKRIVNLLTLIMTGKNEGNIYVPDTFKSIKDRLAGKKGLIRDKMQGGRLDYSGRTVIVNDPYLPMDTVKIPRRILGKLYELGIVQNIRNTDASKDTENLYKMALPPSTEYMNRQGMRYIQDGDEYVIIGRQPTLFNLGIRAFKVIPTDGNAIVISPLIVMPYNADFDGDQMHMEVAVTEEAKREVRRLMESMENLRYTRNGEITVVPRHEILYGLWICSKVATGLNQRTWNSSQLQELATRMGMQDEKAEIVTVFHGVCCQEINVYDIIEADSAYGRNGTHILNGCTAGVWALKYVIGKGNSDFVLGRTPLVTYEESGLEDKPCKTGWFKAIIANTPTQRKQQFMTMINNMVKLGFKVARIYPPNISIINNIDFSQEIDEFNKKIMEREMWINLGFELESSFTEFFGNEFNKLNEYIKSKIIEELGEDNGFVRLCDSGAKGNISNLVQIFGTKGRIMKNDNEAFNTIIKNSLSTQFTSLESFITAYGSREGLADKVLATAEPGYLTRRLEHASACMQITTFDCGTDEGLHITYDDIIVHIDETKLSNNVDMDYQHVETFAAPMLVGRVILPHNVYVDSLQEAERILRTTIVEEDGNGVLKIGPGITIRSPLKCKCPVCCMCYGRDLMSGENYSKVGRPIGIIAGQAIGEPAAQLTMKNFQRGGVASEANLTSAFDKINAYFSVPKGNGSTASVIYDHLSPVRGYVKPQYNGDGTKTIKVYEPYIDINGVEQVDWETNVLSKSYKVPENLRLKDFVEVGDSFQLVQGDLNTREILDYRGFDEAAKYLTIQMYKIFNDETEISLKHFETVVASMISFLVVRGDDQVYTGEVLSAIEYYKWSPHRNTSVIPIILGISELPSYRRDALEAFIMEDMGTHVLRNIIISPYDEMKNPKTRLSFGLGIGMGTDIPGFMD